MGSKLKVEEFHDCRFGRVRRFNDYWRDAKAVCFLFGDGPGPEGELVRLVGKPKRGGEGFKIFYVRSYEPRQGYAAKAYGFIFETYGMIDAIEIASPAGLALNEAMKKAGLVDKLEIEKSAYGPAVDHQPVPSSGF
jgi:hypothetical protein